MHLAELDVDVPPSGSQVHRLINQVSHPINNYRKSYHGLCLYISINQPINCTTADGSSDGQTLVGRLLQKSTGKSRNIPKYTRHAQTIVLMKNTTSRRPKARPSHEHTRQLSKISGKSLNLTHEVRTNARFPSRAGFLANSISSPSHNFPNIAPIDVLFDSDCSLDLADQICILSKVNFPPISMSSIFTRKNHGKMPEQTQYIFPLLLGNLYRSIDQSMELWPSVSSLPSTLRASTFDSGNVH